MSDSDNSNEDRMAEQLEKVHQRIIETSHNMHDLPPSDWNVNSGHTTGTRASNLMAAESGETESSKPADAELSEAEGLLRLISMVRHHWKKENDPAFNAGRANETRLVSDSSTAGDHDSVVWSREDSAPTVKQSQIKESSQKIFLTRCPSLSVDFASWKKLATVDLELSCALSILCYREASQLKFRISQRCVLPLVNGDC